MLMTAKRSRNYVVSIHRTGARAELISVTIVNWQVQTKLVLRKP
jgi:hypothetical protein